MILPIFPWILLSSDIFIEIIDDLITNMKHQFLQDGPLPAISRVITLLIGVK